MTDEYRYGYTVGITIHIRSKRELDISEQKRLATQSFCQWALDDDIWLTDVSINTSDEKVKKK